MQTQDIQKLNEVYAYKKGKPIYTSNNMLTYKHIECNRMDRDWKESIKDKWWAVDYIGNYTPKQIELLKIRNKLLSFSGEEACLAFDESPEDIDKLLNRGQLWYGDMLTMQKGEASHCHQNSALLWNVNKHKLTIATGYALSDDGMWRQHSWCVWGKVRANRIVETTEPRLLYYGYVMTQEECEEFYNYVLN